MSNFFKFFKKHFLDLFIIAILLVLNLFWLPTFSHWALYPSAKEIKSENQISEFTLPKSPIIKLDSKPILTTNNYILIDVATNKILLTENPTSRIYPASITKLATALTALNIYSLDEIVTVKEEYKEGKIMELQLGEKISVQSLVSALLIHSANDAAFTLAQNYQQGSSAFIQQMNLIAQKYNLNNTHFTNVDGIHNPDHYSTVYDLSQLGRIAIQNKIVSDTVKTKELLVFSEDKSISHQLESTNELLGVTPEIEGLKTGWTPEAKGCFISLININDHYLISVVAQSDDRFQDTLKIINWAKKNISWED